MNSKWNKDPYVKPKTIKLLEANIDVNLCDLEYLRHHPDSSQRFTSITESLTLRKYNTKSTSSQRKKIDKLDFIQHTTG